MMASVFHRRSAFRFGLPFGLRFRLSLRLRWYLGAAWILFFAWLGLGAAADPLDGMVGRPLAEVLEELRQSGLDINFSSHLVPSDLVVERAPAGRGENLLKDLLAPHGLTVRVAAPGRFWVVPADRPAVIRGVVVERSTGAALAGAAVWIGERQTRSGADGGFELGGLPPGHHVVRVWRRGFGPGRRGVRVLADGDAPFLRFALQAEMSETLEVAARPLAGDDGEELAEDRRRLADQLYRDLLAEAGGWRGVTALDGGLSVRGDRAGRMALVLDGHEVLEPYHLRDFGALLGLVAPISVASARLHHDWLPPGVGERSDAVLELVTRDSDAGWLNGEVGAGDDNVQAALSGQALSGRMSWLAAYRVGRPDVASELAESSERPQFWDGFGRLSFDLSDRRHLVLRSLLAHDGFFFVRETGAFGGDQFIIDHDLRDSWAEVSQTARRSLWLIGAHHSRLTRNRFGVLLEGEEARGERDYAFEDFRRQKRVGLRLERSLWRQTAEWTFGLALRGDESALRYTDLVADFRPNPVPGGRTVYFESFRGTHGAVHVEARRPGARVTRVWGMRVDRPAFGGELLVSPRWSTTRVLAGGELRWTAGLYHRAMRPIEIAVEDGDTRLYRAERASRASVTYSRRFGRQWQASFGMHGERVDHPWPRLENLYKPVSRFPEAELDRRVLRPSRGRSLGFEVEVRNQGRKRQSRLLYRLGTAADRVAGELVPRAVDRRHWLRLESTFALAGPWRLTVTWSAASGAPHTPYLVVVEDPVPRWIAGPPLSERLPSSHRLDVALGRSFTWRGLEILSHVGIDNLYDHRAVRGFDTELRPLPDGSWLLQPELGLGFTARAGLRVRFRRPQA